MELNNGKVAGFCPMGCGETLLAVVAGGGAQVRCSSPWCTHPAAAHEILSDPETEHVVTLKASTFTVRHPLRERLGQALDECSLPDFVRFGGIKETRGRYRAVLRDGWQLERLED